jgi:hypothetical protein
MQQIHYGKILDQNKSTVLPLPAKPWKDIMVASSAAVPSNRRLVAMWSNCVIKGKL